MAIPEKYEGDALALGFSRAVLLENYQLEAEEKFRAYCNPDECDRYGNTWVCPPGCGSVAEYRELFSAYQYALVLQTIVSGREPFHSDRHLSLPNQNPSDWEPSGSWDRNPPGGWDRVAVYRAEKEHNQKLMKLAGLLKSDGHPCLALSTGGCILCDDCSFPAGPCLKPEERMHSLSAAGVDVEKLCRKAGLDFSFGGDSIYYTACLVF